MLITPVQAAASEAPARQELSSVQSLVRVPRCLLIVSGAPACLNRMLAALQRRVALTWTAAVAEVPSACRDRYDLVIVDVEPQAVPNVLNTVRTGARLNDCPVLVEGCRLALAPELAGVLPRYRAMQCGFADLLKLAHCHLFPTLAAQSPRAPHDNRFL